MSCGFLLAMRPSTVVVTVFAGLPDPPPNLRPWDADCGFTASEEAISVRHQEDDAALRTLGCAPARLPFGDRQYGVSYADEAISVAVGDAITAAGDGAVAVPLGLFHDDHIQTSRASLAACRRQRRRTFVYADVPYRRLGPDVVNARLENIARDGIELCAPVAVVPATERDAARKRRAVSCYRSQLRGLGTAGRLGIADTSEPETYWEVARYS